MKDNVVYKSISTKRLVLRQINPDDAQKVFAYRADPDVAKYQRWKPKSIEDVLVACSGYNQILYKRPLKKSDIVINLEEAALYPLRDTLFQKYRFDADLKHLAISGECSKCWTKKRSRGD